MTEQLENLPISDFVASLNELCKVYEDSIPPKEISEVLKTYSNKYKDKVKNVQQESAYSSRHTSTPPDEKAAEEIVIKNEKIARELYEKLKNNKNM